MEDYIGKYEAPTPSLTITLHITESKSRLGLFTQSQSDYDQHLFLHKEFLDRAFN